MEGLLLFLLWLCVYAIIIGVVCWVIVQVITVFVSPPPPVIKLIYVIGILLLLIWTVTHMPGLKFP